MCHVIVDSSSVQVWMGWFQLSSSGALLPEPERRSSFSTNLCIYSLINLEFAFTPTYNTCCGTAITLKMQAGMNGLDVDAETMKAAIESPSFNDLSFENPCCPRRTVH